MLFSGDIFSFTIFSKAIIIGDVVKSAIFLDPLDLLAFEVGVRLLLLSYMSRPFLNYLANMLNF